MVNLPEFTGSLGPMEALVGLLLAVFGVIVHETLHWAALKYYDLDYDVRVLNVERESVLKSLMFSNLFGFRIKGQPPRRQATIFALAPLIGSIFPVAAIAYALRYPVIDIGSFIALGVWFAVSFPSPTDWNTALRYRPDDTPETEVTTHG